MQKVHNFVQGFLGFVLARHIGKGLAGLAFHINFGVALAKLQGVAAHALGHHIAQQLADNHKEYNGQYPGGQKTQQGRILGGNGGGKLHARGVQPVHQAAVLHAAGFVDDGLAILALGGKDNLVVLNGYFLYLLGVHHFQEVVVAHLLHLGGKQVGEYQRVQ